MDGWTGSPKTTLLIMRASASKQRRVAMLSHDQPRPGTRSHRANPLEGSAPPKPSCSSELRGLVQTINCSESRLSLHDTQHSLLHEQTYTPLFKYIPNRSLPLSRPRSCSEVCPISHGPSPETTKSRWRYDASSVRSVFCLSGLP